MTRKDLDIEENRYNVAIRAGYLCEVCGKSLPFERGECAHIIPQRKNNITKYGEGVIHHNMNMKWTCPEHNNAVSIGNKPVEQELLAKQIRMRILEDAAIRIQVSPHLYVDLINKLAKIARGDS